MVKRRTKKPAKSASGPASNGAENENFSVAPYRSNESARKIMWTGVFILSAAIIILWSWAFTLRISAINLGEVPEKQIFNETKKSWDAVFEETKARETKKQSLAQLKILFKSLLESSAGSAENAGSDAATTTITTTTKQL